MTTEMIHIHEGDKHVGNICVSRFSYRVVVHEYGAHKWTPLPGNHRTITAAFSHLGKVLDSNRGKFRRYNRAGIWSQERGISYYEPHQVYEVTVL